MIAAARSESRIFRSWLSCTNAPKRSLLFFRSGLAGCFARSGKSEHGNGFSSQAQRNETGFAPRDCIRVPVNERATRVLRETRIQERPVMQLHRSNYQALCEDNPEDCRADFLSGSKVRAADRSEQDLDNRAHQYYSHSNHRTFDARSNSFVWENYSERARALRSMPALT